MLTDTLGGFIETNDAPPPQATFSSAEPIGPRCEVSRKTIGQASPHLSPEEIELKFVEIHYGKSRAQQVRETLMRRRATCPEPCSQVEHYYGVAVQGPASSPSELPRKTRTLPESGPVGSFAGDAARSSALS